MTEPSILTAIGQSITDIPTEKYITELTTKWKKEDLPIGLIEKDPLSARLFEENAVFAAFKFYGLNYSYENDELLVPVKKEIDGTSSTTMLPWSSLRDKIYYVNNNGWLQFDNTFINEHGFTGILSKDHLWKWKELKPCYTKNLPDYCYMDIVSGSWEYLGLPGFGLLGSHGHCWIEISSPEDGMISVGQWPDPYRGDDRLWTNWIFGSCKPVIMCPDPYTTCKGEKVVHRYFLGTGEHGQQNIEKIKNKILEVNEKTIITAHNSVTNNCADFAMNMEKFVIKEIPGVFLMDLSLEEKFPPTRRKTNIKRQHNKRATLMSTLRFIYHYWIIFWVNVLLNVLYFVPVLGKKLGKGVGVKIKLGEREQEIGKLKSLHWKSPNWPRKLRIQQQYSPRLSRHSMSFAT
jgi:hypothetical protein